jgi:subtilase family serine protease
VLGLATIALTGAFAASGAQASTAAPAAAAPALTTLSGSLSPTTDRQTGAYTASRMTVEVALAPRDEAGLNAELQAVYTKGNPRYGKFLRAGQFDALYAPTTASRNSVEDYLRSAGLAVSAGDSPFVIEATGASAKITAAFHTTSQATTYSGEAVANGETACTLAKAGTPCRQEPDVSANADPYTGYSEYCTGSASTPYSDCATFSGGQPVPGWFAIGGTSLSSPLWSALIADRDSFSGQRTGNINPLVYSWLDTDPGKYFNDITGNGKLQQAATNNGLFPTTPGYDEATGIGTPKFAAIITTR